MGVFDFMVKSDLVKDSKYTNTKYVVLCYVLCINVTGEYTGDGFSLILYNKNKLTINFHQPSG